LENGITMLLTLFSGSQTWLSCSYRLLLLQNPNWTT
jgi:hypothetical protein